MGNEYRRFIILVTFLWAIQLRVNSVFGICEHSFLDGNKLYNFTLASPMPSFPHGVRSEDGFYKVAANETVLWFQLCGGMIFNHNPPKCAECSDCGGPSRCGMECSALVAESAGGYHVCTTIGQVSSTDVSILDELNPFKGVIVRMLSSGKEHNCSLSVSILCDSTGAQGPYSIEKLGSCEYHLTDHYCRNDEGREERGNKRVPVDLVDKVVSVHPTDRLSQCCGKKLFCSIVRQNRSSLQGSYPL